MATEMKASPVVRLYNAGLDDKNGEIVAHGWLDIPSMLALKVDTYQREVLASSPGRRSSLQKAIADGVRLPDIMVGMRGEHFATRGDNMVLEDKAYIIDGLQRVSALLMHAEANPDVASSMRIGAEVRFNTDFASEKQMFEVLNIRRVPVSPNVIMRNARHENKAILTLYGLSMSDTHSPLYKRVQWEQRKQRGELITGVVLARTSLGLHKFTGRGQAGGYVHELIKAVERVSGDVGLKTYRDNIVAFFNVIDEVWGLRHVEYSALATHLRGNLLVSVARLMSDHLDFWDGAKLRVPAAIKSKLKTFPVQDPEIARLASAGSQTLPILYGYLREHINKGKSVHKLRPRHQAASHDIDQKESGDSK